MEDHHKSVKIRKQKVKRSVERIQIKSGKDIPDHALLGKVIFTAGKNYIVVDENNVEFECIVSGTISTEHGKASVLAVGDNVQFLPPDDERGINYGSVISVETRESWLSRKPLIGIREDVLAVNADHLLIIMSADNPIYNTRLIDRLLVAAQIGNLNVSLCINKVDLYDVSMLKKELAHYKKIVDKLFFVSCHKNYGIDELVKYLNSKKTIFAGPSGVGKSTVLNKILGYDAQKIQTVSDKWKKGKHTTSSARLYKISDDFTIIDTPGIREFGIVNIDKEELTLYFREFEDCYEHCKFMPCSHTHEPGCEVKDAVERGKINFDRYQSYINIYESLKD